MPDKSKESDPMKKLIALLLALVCAVGLFGCATHPVEHIQTIEGNF